MKNLVVIFAALFSIAGNATTTDGDNNNNWLSSRRQRSAIETSEILELLEALMELDFFRKLLDYDYTIGFNRFRLKSGRTLANTVSRVHDEVLGMSCRLMGVSHAYMAIHMIEYFEQVGWYVRRNPEKWNRSQESRDLIGLHNGRGFCVLTAFHDLDCGIDVDRALESVFFAQSLGREKNARYTTEMLLDEIASYQKHYENYLKLSVNSRLPRAPPHSSLSLPEVKKAITDFSDVFCTPRWRPFVPDVILSGRHGAVDHRKHKSMYVRQLFDRRACEILKSMLHGYPRYRHTVMQVVERKTAVKPSLNKKEMCSLDALRDLFADEFIGYKHAVNYDEIASTAMLMFSIMEGSKIFIGIKHAVASQCVATVDENTGETRYRITEDALSAFRHHRTTLSAFKAVFDRLVALMAVEKRIDVSRNFQKIKFDDRAKSIAELLDVVTDTRTDDDDGTSEAVQKMCTGVLEILFHTYFDYAPHESDTVRFPEFFFTQPLLYISELYRFYAYVYL